MEKTTTIALLIIFLPLISFIYQIFFGSILKRNTHFISLGLIGIVLALSIGLAINAIQNGAGTILEISTVWFASSNFSVELGFYIDHIAALMITVVSLISFLVHLYSTEYMRGDPRYSRYFGFLGIFTFSMNGIVLADSLIMMYVFWELVGLSSYLLIGFWFEKDSAANACKKAFLTNRVGDIGMFIGIMLLFFQVGSFNILDISEATRIGYFDGNQTLLTISGILVFMGAVGKSAQFPLHIWLPDAMEGPTPVSALIHAATMVAAGVYMVIRIFSFLTPVALQFIAVVGAITALMAAIIAITQTDIKRVLAYSTVSQLGYMIMALGVGAYQAAFFHLVTHAMFKACLFLNSGSVIHGMHHALHKLKDHDTDPQDMRNMGGLKLKMPITYWTMLISTLAISGVPFFSGFLSKDAILAGTVAYFQQYHGWTIILPIAGFGAAIITAFYMFRLIFMTFHGKPKEEKIIQNIQESPIAMTFPLILLSILSFAVIFTFPHFNPIHSTGWFTELVPMSENFAGLNTHLVEESIHHAHNIAMIISLIVASLGIFIAVMVYLLKKINTEKWVKIFNRFGLYNLSLNKFYIDEIYNIILYKPFLLLTKIFSWIDWELYDRYFINGWGWITIQISRFSGYADYSWLDQKIVDGFGKITDFTGKKLRLTQTGVIQTYIVSGTVGIILIFLIFQNI